MCDEQSYTEYQLKKRTRLRQFVRDIYLGVTFRLLQGRTIDFGCGTGELLKKLPSGSVGLELNPVTVAHCRGLGLNVQLYNPLEDKYLLSDFISGEYESLVISHVLEHMAYSEQVLLSLLQTSRRLGIQRVVVIVPGEKGYSFDSTHQTYIDPVFLEENNLTDVEGFEIVMQRYFPINWCFIGKFFTHFELQVVYDRKKQ